MPTIKDIAREAGVSHGTVSNVLNKTGKVSVEKIRLVEEAARRLGYVPNVQAQMLRQGTPSAVAIIIPSLNEDTYLDLYTALQSCLSDIGYETSVYTTLDIPANEEAILDRLPFSRLVAIVTISCLGSECRRYANLPCPTVFIEREPEFSSDCFISFDFLSAGEELGAYLIQKQKKQVAFFSSPTFYSNNSLLLKGIKKALLNSDISLQTFSSDLHLSLNKAFDIIASPACFDTVITTTFYRAKAISTALQLTPPGQPLEIISLDSAKHVHSPGITTYELDYSQLGVRITDLISLRARHKSAAAEHVILKAKGFPFRFPGIAKMAPQTLTMLTLDSPSTNALRKLLPMYESVSGVSLKLVTMPYEDLHAQLNLLTPDFHYDLIRIDVAQFDTLGQKIYLPLEAARITPELLPPQLVHKTFRNYSLLDHTLYALPLDPSVQILLYRKDLFCDTMLQRTYYEKYREPLSLPATIPQYLKIAEFFTQSCTPDSPVRYGTAVTGGSAIVAASDFLPYYLPSCTEYPSACLDTPEMACAMEQYLKMSLIASRQNWWSDSIRQFAEGMTAMTIIYSNHAAGIINSKHSSVVGKVGAAIVPGGHPLLGGGIVGISRYCTSLEACRSFFEWYYSPDTASLMVHLGGSSPLVDVYNDFKNFSAFPWLAMSKKSFEKGIRGTGSTSIPGFSTPLYEYAIGSAVRHLTNGLFTPAEAAKRAQMIYDHSIGSS